jgi:hypothetical protein
VSVCLYVCVPMSGRVYACMYVCVDVCTCVRMYVCMYVYIYIYIYIYTYIYIYIYIYILVYIHIYMYIYIYMLGTCVSHLSQCSLLQKLYWCVSVVSVCCSPVLCTQENESGTKFV